MTPEELRKMVADADLEIAAKVGALAEELRASKITKEEADKQVAELRAKKADLERQLAQAEMPKAEPEQKRFWKDVAEAIRTVGREQRSITVGNNGQINQLKDVFSPVDEKDGLLDKASYFYGPNASTNIPVITSPLGDPAGIAEGADGVADDATMAMGTTEIQPKNYMAVLPITAEALTLNSVGLESMLPEIFNKAFKKLMRKGMLTGAGTSKAMKGIFVSVAGDNAIETSAAGKISVVDLAGLAVKVAGYDEPYTIVMSPSVYAHILADTSTDETTKIYKEEIIKSKSIEGVPIKLEQNAPQFAATAGTIPVCAAPLGRYAIGVANTVTIDPIKIKGDSKTYFQATMFFSGKQVLDSDCYGLKIKSA